MSGIIIDRDDLTSIIAALVATAESGIEDLKRHPTAENAATLADLYRLTARLLRQTGAQGKDADAFDHNARELTRMIADLELAKVGGYGVDVGISTATIGG